MAAGEEEEENLWTQKCQKCLGNSWFTPHLRTCVQHCQCISHSLIYRGHQVILGEGIPLCEGRRGGGVKEEEKEKRKRGGEGINKKEGRKRGKKRDGDGRKGKRRE